MSAMKAKFTAKFKAKFTGPDMFDAMPKFLRHGPWSPMSYVYLLGVIGWIIFQSHEAINTSPAFNPTPENDEGDGMWRFFIFIYGLGVTLAIIWTQGIWPMYSFTMMSWSLFTVRYLFSSLYHSDLGIPLFYHISESLRFPSLVCNSITIAIWWIALVPSIYIFVSYKMGHEKGKKFLKWNLSPMLMNIHVLNLPLCALDHVFYPRMLTFFDLWIALVITVIYILFYLFILDPLGLHFYHIILSPRPHWCVIPYSMSLGLFPLFLWGWNTII